MRTKILEFPQQKKTRGNKHIKKLFIIVSWFYNPVDRGLSETIG